MSQCVLCAGKKLTKVNSITFGVWQTASRQAELVRDTQNYDVVECENCEHVQVSAQYHQALFEKLYFHSDQEEVMWHESLVGNYQAYQDMVEFSAEVLPAEAKIADFGCGTGSLLSAYNDYFSRKCTTLAQSGSKLFGIDFNPRCKFDFIEYISADLNIPAQFTQCKIPQGYDLVCASHTLEHVVDPVSFLRGMGDTLSDNGHMFIEVPDFSVGLHRQLAGQSNLVNLQHIQYFTAKTLAFCAQQAGFQVIKCKQVTSGYIPRLLVILAKCEKALAEPIYSATHSELMNTQTQSASHAINQFLRIASDKRQTLLQSVINSSETIGLWGLGADFYIMLRDFPDFTDWLATNEVTLFDYEHAGKIILGRTIQSSKDIPAFNGQVYLLPMLAETRVKMHAIGDDWPAHIVDLYQQDLLDVEGIAKQACQICQNTDWLAINTLSSGIWQQSAGKLERDELLFPIGECKACKHTQIYAPYSHETFAKLYFSSDQQPEMWHTSLGQPSPYFEMLELFADELPNMQSVADFGCGEGLLMRELKRAQAHLEIVGFDFNIQGKGDGIKRVSCDLNNQVQVRKAHGSKKFDLITSSHVLEHVINPVMFLHSLKSRLNENGLLFIEVPDSSACHRNLQLHSTNLVHGQHIHYYTQDSLSHIASRVGLSLVSQKQFVTGDIPRLQMLFKQAPSVPKFVPRIIESAYTTVSARFSQYKTQLQLISDYVEELVLTRPQIGLWGVGGDFYQLTQFNPRILDAITQGEISLFDYNLKGQTFANNLVQDSALIRHANFPVVLTPMYLPTRARMIELSKTWPTQIVDPYQI